MSSEHTPLSDAHEVARVNVGPIRYSVRLANPVRLDGIDRRAVCDGDARTITIDSALAPDHRVVEFWHEYGHALIFELDVHERELLGHEAIARIVALGMADWTPARLASLHRALGAGGGG